MSKLLFRMRHVPEDEAEEVRQLLIDHDIEFFETFAGSWGISLPAIWLKQIDQFDFARKLLDEYQEQRRIKMRGEYEKNRSRGDSRTLWRAFREAPGQFLIYLFLIVIVAFLSLQFFLSF